MTEVAWPDAREAAVAAVAGIAAVSGSYLAAGPSPSFVITPVDRLIVDLTPGPIVTFMIETVGDWGHVFHVGMAVAAVVGLFGLVSLGGLRAADRVDRPLVGALAAGFGSWLLAVGLTGRPGLALGASVPAAVVTAIGGFQASAEPVDGTRRRTIVGAMAAAAGIAGVSLLGRRLADDGEGTLPDAPGSAGAGRRIEALGSKSLSLESDDLTGLVSPIGGFYNVDIAQFDPEITADEWSLTFTGEVGSERTVTYDELTDRPIEHRAVTLRCVGEPVNGRKLDTAVWTGTPIRPLLEAADPEGACNCAMLRGEDGYYVQFPVDVLAEGFLAWGMNGTALPSGHGHPVRVLIPGHWGETNVKWLTEIELLNVEADGYWEERGWEGTGPVNTVAKLWDEGITERSDGRIELAGHAYAGTRGIERVEVSVDGGNSWTDATLSDPSEDVDVWRQWAHTFDPDGTHEVVVRATDGEGNRQPREKSDPSPTGASGWVTRTVGD